MNGYSPRPCFHCGLPVPSGSSWQVRIDGEARAMCCPGCQAVAETIVAQGLGRFYQLRSTPSAKGEALVPAELQQLALLDRADVQQDFVRQDGERREASLALEGVNCAACVWLIEKRLARLPGVDEVTVNAGAQRLHLRWQAETTRLSRLLGELHALGYRAHPIDSPEAEAREKRAERQFLARLGVAGLGMMQAMMYAANLYAGPDSDIEPTHLRFLHLTSLLVSLPVVFYSAWPFYVSAWRNLKAGQLIMDLPVSLAILSAFVMSAIAALGGAPNGEIYFDSVTMFTFFLLIGRYLERRMSLRARYALTGQRRLLPRQVIRVTEDGDEAVLLREVQVGQRLRVRPGETLAADGLIVSGQSQVDEALLTGEALPIAKGVGDKVIAGSINIGSPLLIDVERLGADTRLSALVRLQDRALAEKPRIALQADRIARWFVLGLLLVSAATWLCWEWLDPSRAFAITLSVLVVTCPCALALATPIALTAAGARLARAGLLLARGQALETLATITHVVMDKTGTLTTGQIAVQRTEPLAELDQNQCLQLAAALESGSEHPIARAFAPWRDNQIVSALHAVPGQGMEGQVNGRRLRIGQRDYVAALCGRTSAADSRGIYLGDERGLLARFEVHDSLRPDAGALVQALQARGLQLEILSGDPSEAPLHLAKQLGIGQAQNRVSPEQKLAHIHRLQSGGAVVLMVGDGVNDAPVLAGANVSLAMGAGADLAKTSADLVLLNDTLAGLDFAVGLSRKTRRIVRENLAWALAYNILALPAAALGYVPPWLAAAGMSLSSLLVVLNALRLNRKSR